MKTKTALDYYGGSPTKVAEALGISQASVSLWGEIVPPLRQLQLEKVTGGALKASANVFSRKRRAVA